MAIALGGGCEWALATDYRVASETATNGSTRSNPWHNARLWWHSTLTTYHWRR